jgi:hypothetical protein
MITGVTRSDTDSRNHEEIEAKLRALLLAQMND